MDNVIITTNRTEMKFPLSHINADDVVRAIGDEETIRYMDSVPSMTYTLQDAERFIGFLQFAKTSEKHLQLGVFDLSSKEFIGMCTLESIDLLNNSCELGYWLSKKYVGTGLMFECTSAIIEHAKSNMRTTKINAYVLTQHNKSISLLERLGFKNIELLKRDTENKGIVVDRYRFELSLTND